MKNKSDEQIAAEVEFGNYSADQARATIATLKASKEAMAKLEDPGPAGRLARASWTFLHRQGYPNPS